MTYREAMASLQLAAEERIGHQMREQARQIREQQDAAAGMLRAAADGVR